MKIEKGDPDNVPDDDDVRLNIKAFYKGDDLGFHMEGEDGVEDPELLIIFSTLNQVIAQTIAGLERKILGNVLDKDRERLKRERVIDQKMKEETPGDPN